MIQSMWLPECPREPRATCRAVEKNVMNESIVESLRGRPGLAPNHFRICHAVSNFLMISRNGRCASYVQTAIPISGVNPSLRMKWRPAVNFAKQWKVSCVAEELAMSPDALNSLFSLCIGFALAGALVSGYQALLQRPAGFGLLQEGVAPKTFAAVPFLVFAAPFIIMRNTLRGSRIERRRAEFVMMATVLAGFWSLMSGTFFLMTLRAAGLLA
jgi:hypothetical protein